MWECAPCVGAGVHGEASIVPAELLQEDTDRGIPRKDYAIQDAAGNNIGTVTSGTQSPSLGQAIGLGYVASDWTAKGAEIFISIRGKSIGAVVTGVPFL